MSGPKGRKGPIDGRPEGKIRVTSSLETLQCLLPVVRRLLSPAPEESLARQVYVRTLGRPDSHPVSVSDRGLGPAPDRVDRRVASRVCDPEDPRTIRPGGAGPLPPSGTLNSVDEEVPVVPPVPFSSCSVSHCDLTRGEQGPLVHRPLSFTSSQEGPLFVLSVLGVRSLV